MRVRIKELQQESKFIRHEENKIRKRQKIAPKVWDWRYENGEFKSTLYCDPLSKDFWKLQDHRKDEVRHYARAAQLAYAFLRGVPYSKVEPKRKPENEYVFQSLVLKHVKRMVDKFGGKGYSKDVDSWLST